MKINPPLIAIFLGALVVRALCAAVFFGEIDPEGSEYARIAQNIANGKGYVGITTEGSQLIFPPLFPFLIASMSFLSSSTEVAGRSLNVICGALLIFPVYFIGYRAFGRKAALGGAALVALHPYLVSISTGVNCEPTYYAILFTAIYLSMRASDNPSLSAIAICGALYGLAYLVRQEALAFMITALLYVAVSISWRGKENATTIARRLSLMPACFLVLAAPYIAWISLETGRLRVEAKSPLNIETEMRMQHGLSMDEAAFAVGTDAYPLGVWNRPNLDVIKASRPNASELLSMALKKSVKVIKKTTVALAGNLTFGSPALIVLAVLGIFSRAWRPPALLDQVYLALLISLTVFATFFIYYSHDRFYFFPLVVFCIWASAGLFALRKRVAQSAAMLGMATRGRIFIGNAARVIAIAAVIVPSAASASSAFLASRDTRPIRAFAARLAASGDALRVADTTSSFAYHAGAKLIWLPYCDEQTALSYLRKQVVTHVVVDEEEIASRPYLGKWLEQGVPNSQEMLPPISGTRYKVRLFKFNPNPA
jgi:4-amino-4-deoxy-L-arabinose transferase-like glycosyltransferase